MKPFLSIMMVLAGVFPYFIRMEAEGSEASSHFLNEKWGYYLEYPSGWIEKIDLEPNKASEKVVRQRVALRSPEGVDIYISVWENISGLSLEEWFSRYQKPSWKDILKSPPSASFIISGKPAMVFEIPSTGQAYGEWLALFSNNGLIYEISYISSDQGSSLDYFWSILDSFTCLE